MQNSNSLPKLPKDLIKSNWIYIIWFAFYFSIAWSLLGTNIISFFILAVAYAVSIRIALSDIGEKLLRFMNNVRILETKKEKEYLFPIFADVYIKAKENYPDLRKDIQICIVDAMYINACALGRYTIAVTKGAINSLSEEELKGFIAHELGHIAHGDTIVSLLTNIGNGIFAIVTIIFKLIMLLMEAISMLFGGKGIASMISFVTKMVMQVGLFLLVYIGEIILSINSRRNEYSADEFAYNIGYGDNLIESLYLLQDMSISGKNDLVQKLKSSHPNIAKRIGRLEMLLDGVKPKEIKNIVW